VAWWYGCITNNYYTFRFSFQYSDGGKPPGRSWANSHHNVFTLSDTHGMKPLSTLQQACESPERLIKECNFEKLEFLTKSAKTSISQQLSGQGPAIHTLPNHEPRHPRTCHPIPSNSSQQPPCRNTKRWLILINVALLTSIATCHLQSLISSPIDKWKASSIRKHLHATCDELSRVPKSKSYRASDKVVYLTCRAGMCT
jgi:hypothetical protein